MYTVEQLTGYTYFADQLEETGLKNMLDPLTGLVCRTGMIGLVESLIAEGRPFAYMILDLDNFKFVNDTYGHHSGDEVLVELARALTTYLGNRGIAGRFGGDEFLILVPDLVTYDDRKAFLKDLYESNKVLRRNYKLSECEPFITGTIGCAGYPENAKTYDELFTLMDKALYRGKTKGRNCYIIYLEEKHKDIEIHRIARQGIYSSLRELVRAFEMAPNAAQRLEAVTPFLMETLQISDLFYVGLDGVMHSVRKPGLREAANDLDKLTARDDMYHTNDLESIKERSPIFHETMRRMDVETVMAVRVLLDGEMYGTLVLAEPRNLRLWQEDECAIMFFLAKMLACRLKLTGEAL